MKYRPKETIQINVTCNVCHGTFTVRWVKTVKLVHQFSERHGEIVWHPRLNIPTDNIDQNYVCLSCHNKPHKDL